MRTKLESGIPIPKNKVGKRVGKEKNLYYWDTMRIGQSFLFPSNVQDNSARSMAGQAGRRYRRVFTVRRCDDGLRAWRIK